MIFKAVVTHAIVYIRCVFSQSVVTFKVNPMSPASLFYIEGIYYLERCLAMFIYRMIQTVSNEFFNL